MSRCKEVYPEMNAAQRACVQMLWDIVGGEQHLFGKIKTDGCVGIQVNTEYPYLSTYDYDVLTRAVILAHDRGIRFGVLPGPAGKIKIVLHKRSTTATEQALRHSTLHEAILKHGKALK